MMMEMCLVEILKIFLVLNEPENEKNKIPFSLENKNLILGKMKMRWQRM